jgi:hypothetical protein
MSQQAATLEQPQAMMLVHPADSLSSPIAAALAPASVPIYVTKATNYTTVDPAVIHFKNPSFRPPILRFHPRSFFDLPTLIARNSNVTDDLAFEAPKNAVQQFCLTRYAIAPTPSGGTQWVSFETVGTAYRLTVHLADVTPAALSQGRARLQPATRYLITASLRDRTVSWDLASAAPTAGAALTLTLDMADPASRDLLYVAMTEQYAQAVLIVRRSLDVAVPIGAPSADAEQQFSLVTTAIDSAIPFAFSKDLDKNIFVGMQGAIGPLPSWNLVSVNWKGRSYRYYQATNQLAQVYFLPDAFKVQRQVEAPHRPALFVTAKGADMASMQMTLSYFASPVWDPQRILAAGLELQKTLGLGAAPNLALFQATDTKLLINLPGADPAAGSSLVEQTAALIDLSAGVQGSVTLPIAQFRDVYDALFDERSAVLSGEIRIAVSSDTVAVPFVARIADMNVDILDIDKWIDTKNNRMVVVLRNGIESSIRIAALAGVIMRNGAAIPSSITSTTQPLPVDLKPASPGKQGDILQIELNPSTGQVVVKSLTDLLSGAGGGKDLAGAVGGISSQILDDSCAPLLDLSRVSVLPDLKAVWRAIMRDQPIGSVTRNVALKLVAASFSKPGAANAIMAVQVVFESGQTASFDANQTTDTAGFLNQTLVLSVPVESFILGTGRTDTYTYRVDIIAADGIRQGDWITDNRDTLFIIPRLT